MSDRKLRFAAQMVMRESFDEVLERTLAAEAAGFSLVLVADHFYTGAGALTSGSVAEAWTTLTALAARTRRLRLGGCVMCNLFRHPCLTANITATLDRISNGRVELGLGAGWLAEEFRRTGLPYPKASERIRMLEEALQIILPALEGQPVTFSGDFYQVCDFELNPTPVQTPRPPLHIGGGGDQLLSVAARHAEIVSVIPPNRSGRLDDESLVSFDTARFEDRIGFLRRAAEEAGRDPEEIEILEYCAFTRVTEGPAETEKILGRLAKAVRGEPAALRKAPLVLVGTPEEIACELEERSERFGIGGVVVTDPSRQTLEVLGKEVVPRLARS